MAASCILIWLILYFIDLSEAVLPCPQYCECPSAQVVDCSKRGLVSWPNGIPASVTTLDLSRNSLTDFSNIANLPRLMSLDLSANSISDITSLSSTSLLHLNLSHNALTNDQGLLNQMINLQSLDLSKNRLSTWYSFIGAKALRTLDISGNEFDAEALKNLKLSHLESLNISNNRLLSLPSRSFEGVPSLRTLISRNCELKGVDTTAFKGLTSLNVLDLSSNSLSALDPEVINDIPNLKLLRLEDAKFLCDCRAAILKETIQVKKLQTGGIVTCYTPKPLVPRNILTTDMSKFCPSRRAVTTTTPPVPCMAPGLVLLNSTSSLAWFKVNVTYDVTIELHHIGSATIAKKRVSGLNPFFVSLYADKYTLCAFIHGCEFETCTIVTRHDESVNSLLCPQCSNASAIGITILIMIVLYIPFFFMTHSLIFLFRKKCQKRPSAQAPRADTLSDQYSTPVHNNNIRQADANHFNRSYIDLNSSDNIIWGKSKYPAPASHYESREDVNNGPAYEELIPDSTETSTTTTVDLIDWEGKSKATSTGEIVLAPGQLDPADVHRSPESVPSVLKEIDRNSVFGNKYGTPHFNRHVPNDMFGPGNYEHLYEEPEN